MRLLHRDELFPFFNWSLFSDTSSERIVHVIRVDSVDERVLPSPRFYFDMTETFARAKQRDSIVSKTVARLVEAIHNDDKQAISRIREVIEDRYMAEVKSAEYDIVQLT